MRALRAAGVLFALAAAIGLVFGTAGFSAMHADRGVDLSITDDESAYLGYETLTDEAPSGGSASVAAYHNQLENDLDSFHVDVSIVDPEETDAEINGVDAPESLQGGEKGAVDVALACSEREAVQLRFEATGSGTGVSVSLDRRHTVTCVPDDEGDRP